MERRYDLDWLRVIAFGLLMLFHTGMMFSTWDWHIKNLETSGTFDFFMHFLHQWRMPLLFFISGSAIWFAMERYRAWRYLLERQKRLLIPLIFGMLVIIPPQVYVERLFNQQRYDSFLDFYPTVFTSGSYPQGNLSWHHLWYVPYIWAYSMLTLPLFLWLRSGAGRRVLAWVCGKLERPWWLVALLVPAAVSDLLVRPFFPEDRMNLLSDWGNFCHKLTFFVTGFILASSPAVSDVIARHRRKFLVAAVVALMPVEAVWLSYWRLPRAWAWLYWVLANANIWMCLLAVLGYGRRYLSGPRPALRYATEAVYPFYILHQTVIVLLGYQLVYANWGIGTKFLLVVTGTFSITWGLYEFVIKRSNLLRLGFGMKFIRRAAKDNGGGPDAGPPSERRALSDAARAAGAARREAAQTAVRALAIVALVAIGVGLAACTRTKGQLICRRFHSPSLETNLMEVSSDQEIVIYLPPNYHAGRRRYPVLYLLPNFTHNLWRYTGGSFQGFHLKDALDQQARSSSGQAREMIVVLPNVNHWLGGSWYRNSPLTGNWEDYVARDLVGYVDHEFRTIPAPASRGVAGHGMGGEGALSLALKHPDVFGCVYAMSPPLFDGTGLQDFGALKPEWLRLWHSQVQRWTHLPTAAARHAFRDFLLGRLNSPDRGLFMQGLFVSYGAAVSPDAKLSYPGIAFPPGDADGEVRLRFEEGFGGVPEKLQAYLQRRERLGAITIECGGSGEYGWIRNGAAYTAKLMTSMGIPNTFVAHDGGHESDLGRRLREGMLPFMASRLKAEHE